MREEGLAWAGGWFGEGSSEGERKAGARRRRAGKRRMRGVRASGRARETGVGGTAERRLDARLGPLGEGRLRALPGMRKKLEP